MAALIGYLEYGHHAGVIHRLAHKTISSDLRTWHGGIDTILYKDGSFYVSVNGQRIAKGNVNSREIEFIHSNGNMDKRT